MNKEGQQNIANNGLYHSPVIDHNQQLRLVLAGVSRLSGEKEVEWKTRSKPVGKGPR